MARNDADRKGGGLLLAKKCHSSHPPGGPVEGRRSGGRGRTRRENVEETSAAIHMSFVGMGVPCFRQLPVNRGVMVGCLLVGVKDSDSRFQEKPSQHRFVRGPWLPAANPARNSPTTTNGSQLASAASNNLHRPSVAATKIRVAMGLVTRDDHASAPRIAIQWVSRFP